MEKLVASYMEKLVAHGFAGYISLQLGLWHFVNHIRLYSVRPKSYVAPPWFPSPFVRHLELILLILVSLVTICMGFIIYPEKHQLFDDDGTIPSRSIHNFENVSVYINFLIYAAFTFYFYHIKMKKRNAMSQFLFSIIFAQGLLIVHVHSPDPMSVEGQYHWLLQIVIAVCLAMTLLSIAFPRSIMVSIVKSISITFQGIWLIIIGIMCTPSLIPKGCFLNIKQMVQCHTTEVLDQANVLVYLQFTWYMAGTVVMALLGYVYITKLYLEELDYLPLFKTDEEEDELEFGGEEMRKLGGLKI